MKQPLPFLLGLLTLFSAGCQQEDIASLPVPGNSGCGQEGARIQATVNGDDWCANTNVNAMSDGSTVTITGLAISGSTLVLEIDSMGLGVQGIDEAQNAVLWMELGMPFTSTNDDPGTLTILSHDVADHRIGGTLSVLLHSAQGPATREVTADFDVHYTVQ